MISPNKKGILVSRWRKIKTSICRNFVHGPNMHVKRSNIKMVRTKGHIKL